MLFSRPSTRAPRAARREGSVRPIALAALLAGLALFMAAGPAGAQADIATAPEEWVPVQLTQRNADADSGFGSEVAVHDDLIAVQGDGTFVFHPSTGTTGVKLTDRVGYLAVADGRVLLGAYNDGIYLYEQTADGWSEEVVAQGIAGPVAFHGDRPVAVGLGSGDLYIYDRGAGGAWESKQLGAGFLSLAATPDRIVVGKISATIQNPAGVVTLFEPRANDEFEIFALLPSDSRPNDTFGWSVDVDGDRIAVGTNKRGKAYVFDYRENRGWVENPLPVPPEAFGDAGSAFGFDVAIEGDRAIIGSPNGTDTITAGASPAVYTYRPSPFGFWQREATLANPGGSPGFGMSLASSPSMVVAGSPLADGGSGRIFRFEESLPVPTVSIEHAVSCLGGNGRIDTNIVNLGVNQAEYRVVVQGLSPRARYVDSQDWWRSPVTGRRNGQYQVVVSRDGEVVSDRQVTVACDVVQPQVTDEEVQVVNACRNGRGYVLFQLVNNSAAEKAYIIEFAGVPNRSTTAAAFGATVRATTSRPDGIYGVTVRSGTSIVRQLAVEVDCEADDE